HAVGCEFVTVDDDVKFPRAKQVGQLVPGPLTEFRSDLQVLRNPRGEFDFEAGHFRWLVFARKNVGAATFLIATPEQTLLFPNLVERVGSDEIRRQQHENAKGGSDPDL